MVVHAGIDGYSRTVVFIKCSDNNRASTVYQLFLEAVGHYGLPSRIRVDQGGENIQVAEHMIMHRGVGRRSVLVGSSVHNQRIGRDSHRCATCFYYRLFYFLEENDLLNPLDEEDLFALHYVYLPRVNRSLQVFRSLQNKCLPLIYDAQDQLLQTSSAWCQKTMALKKMVVLQKTHLNLEFLFPEFPLYQLSSR